VNEKFVIAESESESAWDYPLPPKVEDFPKPIKILFDGKVIVDSLDSKRVLEKGHPPVYYLPMQDINSKLLKPASRRTWCEWKGQAKYFDVVVGNQISRNAAWFYPDPTPEFVEIAGYVAFYADKMEACFVGDERVEAQEGGFYGGWITSNIQGPFKGFPSGKVIPEPIDK
jgi:uncharacterized protein (DUF427 family)